MKPSNNTLFQTTKKSGMVSLLICIICLIYNETTIAQNPANGIEASGITIREDARIVVVDPDNYPAQVGSINTTIESNLTDDNTIFVLQRDAVYWTDGRIENENFRLHIRAEEGDGHPPIVRPAVDLGQSTHMIHSTRDVILEGIMFQGINEEGQPEDILRHVGEGAVLVINNCWLIGAFEYQIRFDGSNNSIYTTNNIILNAGRNTNDQQGRFIDTIGNDQDLIYVENNTVYNMGHSFVRNSGGIVQELYINHNTVMNISQYIRVGETQDMIIKNNIFRNVYTIGEYEDEDERAWIEIREQPSGFNEHDRVLIYSYNNSAYLDEEFFPLIETRNAHHVGSNILKAPDVGRKFMNPDNDLPLVVYENNIEEKIDFTNPPTVDPIYLDWTKQWMMGRDFVSFGSDPFPIDTYPNNPFIFFDQFENTSNSPAPRHFNVDLIRDFTYSSEYESYTAAEDGFPLGDLNWFPEMKQRWIDGDSPTNLEGTPVIPVTFRIVNNYPNPFNPSTTIVYELANHTEVSLGVFNIIGQQMQLMNLGLQTAGRHEVVFDAHSFSSGVYIVRMQAGGEIYSRMITLVK